MDRRRAAAALLALAACIACSTAAPTASNQTALELLDGPTEGCYYNFQHYGEGDRIMTNEPCLNCTCHNRMLMCYLRVCPFTKPIGQDCTVEKRADQCCPIVTCPDVPVDLLTSTSTSSPAEYGSTGVGKLDKYGCSINGKYFSEGSKVPSTPNKPCEHCYCIRNMTTCVMQECTLHVDGCTPIYHKEVCCPVRYSCDHPEDEIPLLDDMTTTVRPTPGFLLTTTTTTSLPVTQMTQDCVHDDQVFPDGALIKTEKACEHCYCMKGDIVCVVQECGTPMENEGKNCTSLPPRQGQCCPDTYICEGDDRGTEITTEITDQPTPPPRRTGVEGSGYRNEPDEPFTEISPFETDIEGSGEDSATILPIGTIDDTLTDNVSPVIIEEQLTTTDKGQPNLSTEPDKGQNTIPDIISEKDGSDLPDQDVITHSTESNVVLTTTSASGITALDENKPDDGSISQQEELITTESSFRKEDNNIVPDEILPIKELEKSSTTLIDLIGTTTSSYEQKIEESTAYNLPSEQHSTTQLIESTVEDIQKGIPTENKSQLTTPESSEEESPKTGEVEIPSSVTTIITEKTDITEATSVNPLNKENESQKIDEEEMHSSVATITTEKTDIPETTSVNPVINEIDENISPPGRIPGEGDCLLNGITYTNNTIVPSTNNCHTSCKCTSSIIKCDPIICSPPPEYMENMNDCQPIYDSPDACCPTYVCSGKETIPPQSHSQMSGTEIPKTNAAGECNNNDCDLDVKQKPIHEASSNCTSDDCLGIHIEKQEQSDCGSNDCTQIDHTQAPISEKPQDCSDDKCQVLPVVACEGDKCKTEPIVDSDSNKIFGPDEVPSVICDENVGCKKPKDTEPEECTDEICKTKHTGELEVKVPLECSGSECETNKTPILTPSEEQQPETVTEEIHKDKVTETSFTELVTTHTELPDDKITTIGDIGVTEKSIPDFTKAEEVYTELDMKHTESPDDEISTIGDTGVTEKFIPVVTKASDVHTELDTKITELPGDNISTMSATSVTEKSKPDVTKEVDVYTELDTKHTESPDDKISTISATSVTETSKPDVPKEADVYNDLYTKHTELPDDKIVTISDSGVTEKSKPDVIEETDVYTDSDTKHTELPDDKISTISDIDVTEKSIPEGTSSSAHLTTSTLTDESDHTVSPSKQMTPEELEEDLRKADKSETESPDLIEDTIVTEQPGFGGSLDDKLPELQDTKDVVTEKVVPQQITEKDKISDESSESTGTLNGEDFTEKIDISTEKHHIDTDESTDFTKHEDISTNIPELAEIDKAYTKIPDLHYTEFEKSTAPESFVGTTEKQPAFEDITEISGTKEESTSPFIQDTVTQQTEASPIEKETKKPSGDVETHTETIQEKDTQDQVGDEKTTDITSGEILHVTLLPESHVTKVETETTQNFEIITESNIITTETSQSMSTKIDEIIKEVPQENITEKQEIHTESSIVSTETSKVMITDIDEATEIIDKEIITETVTESADYPTTKAEEAYDSAKKTTTEQSVSHTEALPPTELKAEVPKEPITEKKTPYTESPETLQTGPAEVSQELDTERQQIYTEVPEHLSTKMDESVTSSIPEKQIEKEYTKAFETDTTSEQQTYTETPKIYITPSEELITNEFEIKHDVSTALPEFDTTPASLATTKDTSLPVTKEIVKVSDIYDQTLYTTSEISETTKTSEHFTEKIDVIVTESAPSQTFKEDIDIAQTTTSVPTKEHEQDLEDQNIVTTLQDSIIIQETSTSLENLIEYTESETKTPLLIDKKPQEVLTEVPEKMPSKSDEIATDITIQDEYTTEQYGTVPQNTAVIEETLSQEDVSTKSPLFDDKDSVSIDVGKPQDTTEETIEINTESLQGSELTPPPDSEVPSQDTEKTTIDLISHQEKETSYTTEGAFGIEETQKEVTDAAKYDDDLRRTTAKSDLEEEEHVTKSPHEDKPVEVVSEEVTTQTEQHIPTEKVDIPKAHETIEPIDLITTKQPQGFTRFEESETTVTTVDKKENDIIKDLPDYSHPSDSHTTSTPTMMKDELDENINIQPEIENKKQTLTTATYIQFEEDKTVTEMPMSLITDKEHKEEVESTTKKVTDQTSEVEQEQTIISDHYTTERQPLATDVSQDTRRQEISTDKITTIGVPEYMTSSYSHETISPTKEKEVKVDELDVTTETQFQKESDMKPTLDSGIQNTEITPIEEELLTTREQETTTKQPEHIEKLTSHLPDYQTTAAIDEIDTEIPNKQITTISPKLESEKDIDEVTKIIENNENEFTTTEYPLDHHETVIDELEKNKSSEPFEGEPHLSTTERIKPSVSEQTEADTVAYPSLETVRTDAPSAMITESVATVHTDKPKEMITESIESDIKDQAHKTTEIPVYPKIETSTVVSEQLTESHEVSETDSPKDGIATTESQGVVIEEQKESSTEQSYISTRQPDQMITDVEKLVTPAIEITEISVTKDDSATIASSYPEITDFNIENQTQMSDKDVTSSIEATEVTESPKLPEKENDDQLGVYTTPPSLKEQEHVTQKESDTTEAEDTSTPEINVYTELSTEKQNVPNILDESYPTTESQHKYSVTTPFLVELEEHTHHVIDEATTTVPLEEIATTSIYESPQPERGDQTPEDFVTHKDEYQTSEPSKTTSKVTDDKETPETHINVQVGESTIAPTKTETETSVFIEKTPESTTIYTMLEDVNRDKTTLHDEEITKSPASQIDQEKEYTTESIETKQTSPSSQPDVQTSSEKDTNIELDKPIQPETPDHTLLPETTKSTSTKISEETSTYSPLHVDKVTTPEEKPIDTTVPHSPEVHKPGLIDEPIEELPSPDFPPSGSGGYGQETDYVDEDQAFGPGTCRYGGKVYVSAQQIPRDDPCDFCFCFRSDIICLQQSCPPPIHGCHEEPIQGFCCPRYECPVSMATTLNVTTTTTTTTTTLPPHFLPHAYKGAAQRRGCQIKGHTYKVGEFVRASSGPCLHCTCGGDGQMKCDPKACTPEPMLRQMIAAAVSAKRRR